jgi:hypothetical protein
MPRIDNATALLTMSVAVGCQQLIQLETISIGAYIMKRS